MKAIDTNITSIVRAIEFIENNLKEELAIADIADAAFYSLYHFCRMFHTITHHTPYDYLMRRRLTESAYDLIKTNHKIIEIAFDYQFNSPEVYARAFKRMFGMQPNQWRKQGKLPQRALMPRITVEFLQHLHQGEYLKPVIQAKEALRVAGLMTLVKQDRRGIAELWDLMAQELKNSEHAEKPAAYYGIAWYPEDWEQHGVFYMAAIAVDASDEMSPALVIKTLPASKYARFIHKGCSKDLHLTFDYIYHTWLPKSGQRLAYPYELESYGQDVSRVTSEASEWEILIPIHV